LIYLLKMVIVHSYDAMLVYQRVYPNVEGEIPNG
jgi:hypothetical protein